MMTMKHLVLYLKMKLENVGNDNDYDVCSRDDQALKWLKGDLE